MLEQIEDALIGMGLCINKRTQFSFVNYTLIW